MDDALAAVGLTGLERREPHLLSEGQKQRLAIAGALALRPAYLVWTSPPRCSTHAGERMCSGSSTRSRATAPACCTSRTVSPTWRTRTALLRCRRGRVVYDGTAAGLLADAELMSAVRRLAAADRRARGGSARSRRAGPARRADAESVVEALWD